jgi:hypothetical protein
MFSVLLYMLRQIVGHHAPPFSFHLFSLLTVTFPKLSVIPRPLWIPGFRGTILCLCSGLKYKWIRCISQKLCCFLRVYVASQPRTTLTSSDRTQSSNFCTVFFTPALFHLNLLVLRSVVTLNASHAKCQKP